MAPWFFSILKHIEQRLLFSRIIFDMSVVPIAFAGPSTALGREAIAVERNPGPLEAGCILRGYTVQRLAARRDKNRATYKKLVYTLFRYY